MNNELVTFEKIGDSTLNAEITINASAQQVFEAWTERESFLMWFGPRANGHLQLDAFDCRVGGKFDFTFVFDDGDRYRNVGEYLEVVPNEKLAFTWNSFDGDAIGKESRVTVFLTPAGDTTLLKLSHERISTGEYRDQFQQGWNSLLIRLETTLSS